MLSSQPWCLDVGTGLPTTYQALVTLVIGLMGLLSRGWLRYHYVQDWHQFAVNAPRRPRTLTAESLQKINGVYVVVEGHEDFLRDLKLPQRFLVTRVIGLGMMMISVVSLWYFNYAHIYDLGMFTPANYIFLNLCLYRLDHALVTFQGRWLVYRWMMLVVAGHCLIYVCLMAQGVLTTLVGLSGYNPNNSQVCVHEVELLWFACQELIWWFLVVIHVVYQRIWKLKIAHRSPHAGT